MLHFRYSRSNFEVENISGQIYSTLEPTVAESTKIFWLNIEKESTFKLQYNRYEHKNQVKRGKSKVQEEEEEKIVRRRETKSKRTQDIPLSNID